MKPRTVTPNLIVAPIFHNDKEVLLTITKGTLHGTITRIKWTDPGHYERGRL